MENKFSEKNIVINMFWRFLEKSGTQFVSFVVGVIIARIIDPEAFGVVAIVNAFTSIIDEFIENGLCLSLYQKKHPDDLDYSTVFITDLVVSLILYIILFVSAPLIANYYDMPQLAMLLRVSGLSLIISTIRSIQRSYVSKNMIFKKFFFSSLSGIIASGIVGIWMALSGFGVWALIVSPIVENTINIFINYFSIKWRPKFGFSFERLKESFDYSSKVFLAFSLGNIYDKLRQLIIGKHYSAEDLAYYDKGESIPRKLTNSLESSIKSVMKPVLSDCQDDKERTKQIVKKYPEVNFLFMTPILLGIAAIADSAIELVYTKKWLFAVPFLRIFCVIKLFNSVKISHQYVIRSSKRSEELLKLELICKVYGLIILFITSKISVLAMTIGLLVCDFADQNVSSFYCNKFINYTYLEQIKDVLVYIIIGTIMYCAVVLVEKVQISLMLTLILQILTGAVVYIAGILLLKRESLALVFDLIKKIIKKK